MWLFSVNLKRHLTAFAAIVLLGGMVQAEPAPPEKLDELRNASEVDAPRIARELERRWPEPSLFPGNDPGLAYALVKWI